ncbi:hypothetical protein RHGRI_014616 [Rhododendron griersonianum]|uniref:Uncharacterized protein n=1 Tax=Rhododendron griersonianum TaxID=479676 RepID=A0AAV6KA19_9ERIC|nr:hypothetical protein RHGRI_014616 [Rhododendron griersonianum]
MMPLQVVCVNEENKTKKAGASFGFGSGTLQGHVLVSCSWLVVIAFSCWDTSSRSFASIARSVTNPFAFSYSFVLSQNHFAHQSTEAIKKHLSPIS